MNQLIKKIQVFVISALIMTLGAAQGIADEGKKEGPCKKIKAACEAAGFKKGGHKEGKGLFVDCVKKLVDGQTVAGVNVEAGLITACRAKRSERKQKHQGKHNHGHGEHEEGAED